VSDATLPKPSLKQHEQALDAEASSLDTQTDVNFRETLALVGRALTFIKYFPVRFATKFFLMWLSLLSPLILPWPIKIVIDNVILQQDLDPGAFPGYFSPFVAFLEGMTPVEMMICVLALGVFMVITIGAFGSTGGAADQTDAMMAEGHDTATKTENEANMAFSKFAGLVGYAEFRLQLRLTQSLNHLLRAQLFERIQRLPMPLLNDQRIGDSLYRVMYDTTAIQNVFFQTIMSPVLAIATAFVVLMVMSFNYGEAPELVYLALCILPLQIIAMLPFPRLIRRRSQASRAAGSITTGNIEEGMSNVLAVQSLGGNKRERERFSKHSNESFKRFRAEILIGMLYGVANGVARGGLALVAFYFVSSRVIEGVLTPGDYGVLLYYYAWLSGALTAVPYVWIRIQADIPGIRRVFFLMDLPSETDRLGKELDGIRESVELEHVGLTYADGRRALDDVNLTMRVGEITALVGPTGAGKTSLAYMVPGFQDPTEGRIRIDGVDIQDLALTSLRNEVSFVFQETQLFSNSIADNIRYGHRDASQEEVERVAQIAGAHEFISELAQGYDTMLGTVTSKLSVGQKQRIAIARGLLKPASVLILDEPTSALDPETESYLVQALHEAAKNKLVIIIAHRLSTIANADKIVFLEDGRVLEEGTHASLMSQPEGQYREFVQLQSATVEAEE
jgi:ABC-type multidrug transport system fused ATPase/permease subunit